VGITRGGDNPRCGWRRGKEHPPQHAALHLALASRLCLAASDSERSSDGLVEFRYGSVERLEVERIPVAGDSVSPGGQDLPRAAAVVLMPKLRGLAAIDHAVKDGDSVSDGLRVRISWVVPARQRRALTARGGQRLVDQGDSVGDRHY
jgi:hypothetical protein